ncbi:hypothetical protein EWM64_g10073 [Hericium alpestre]|uniref:Uncharacterized protein n=1 Tax=Hericium alpestre TaxID=135208 RepID=A0A4Y9ZKI2_9AGAM|nr:hypothetical protein EWM64_g10073 [Hericium alpestre]
MAKKRARGNSAASVEPASKKAKGAGSKATKPASAPDSVKVYAWCFEDMPFEDYRVFVATSSEDLEKLRTWKPKDQDDDEGLPTLMALEFVHHDSLEEDVKGKSRGIAGLFAPFIAEDHEFLLYSDGEPDSALMEITLVKKLPRKGPFSAVDVGSVAHSDLDGFEPVPGHELKEQGYSWVTSVRVERDIEIIRSVQKLVRAHSDGVDTLLEDNKVEASTRTYCVGLLFS